MLDAHLLIFIHSTKPGQAICINIIANQFLLVYQSSDTSIIFVNCAVHIKTTFNWIF